MSTRRRRTEIGAGLAILLGLAALILAITYPHPPKPPASDEARRWWDCTEQTVTQAPTPPDCLPDTPKETP